MKGKQGKLTPEEFVRYARRVLHNPSECDDETIRSVLNMLELSDNPEEIAEEVMRLAEEARVKHQSGWW